MSGRYQRQTVVSSQTTLRLVGMLILAGSLAACGASKPKATTSHQKQSIEGLPKLTLSPQNGLADLNRFWGLVAKHESLSSSEAEQSTAEWASNSLMPFLNARAASLDFGRRLNREFINQRAELRLVTYGLQGFAAYDTFRELSEKAPEDERTQEAIAKPAKLLRDEALTNYNRCVGQGTSAGPLLAAWVTHCKDNRATLAGYDE